MALGSPHSGRGWFLLGRCSECTCRASKLTASGVGFPVQPVWMCLGLSDLLHISWWRARFSEKMHLFIKNRWWILLPGILNLMCSGHHHQTSKCSTRDFSNRWNNEVSPESASRVPLVYLGLPIVWHSSFFIKKTCVCVMKNLCQIESCKSSK